MKPSELLAPKDQMPIQPSCNLVILLHLCYCNCEKAQHSIYIPLSQGQYLGSTLAPNFLMDFKQKSASPLL